MKCPVRTRTRTLVSTRIVAAAGEQTVFIILQQQRPVLGRNGLSNILGLDGKIALGRNFAHSCCCGAAIYFGSTCREEHLRSLRVSSMANRTRALDSASVVSGNGAFALKGRRYCQGNMQLAAAGLLELCRQLFLWRTHFGRQGAMLRKGMAQVTFWSRRICWTHRDSLFSSSSLAAILLYRMIVHLFCLSR